MGERGTFTIDAAYLEATMLELLEMPSPTGYTDAVVRRTGEELERLGLPFELTRRGAIRASLGGSSPLSRAVVAHLDTIGAMVKNLKPNGRLELVPIGSWSPRFAEGARATIFTDEGAHRGTILPLKASGHTFGDAVDTQPVDWTNLELRVDVAATTEEDLFAAGFHVGDTVSIDSGAEVSPTGFVNARHLDDKAGVAAVLAAAKALRDAGLEPSVRTNLLFTISEEVGSGASAVLHGDVAEMVAVDNATPAPGQTSRESGVTIAMADSTGPFDYHLSHHLIDLCRRHEIPHQRDVFRFYRCDAAAAIEAGNDIRTALVCFGADGSHGYERTHRNALLALAELLARYALSPAAVSRDRQELGSLEGFPTQPTEE